jgi:hypothetical protein
VGLDPWVHVFWFTAFFADTQDGGIFTAWFTASIQTIGSLFVPLPVVIAGVSLYTSYQDARSHGSSSAGAKFAWATTFILVIRFVVWPVASIGFIYLLASRTDILGSDTMFFFTLMLMPTGPPAMKLITMVQASDGGDEEEHLIAKLLTVSTHDNINSIGADWRRYHMLFRQYWPLLLLERWELPKTALGHDDNSINLMSSFYGKKSRSPVLNLSEHFPFFLQGKKTNVQQDVQLTWSWIQRENNVRPESIYQELDN